MRARIEDVAAEAGVSIKTVSRVLSAEANVREDTRERVLEAVSRLKYKPHPSARRLAGQRSYEIALVYNNPSLNCLMEVQCGVNGEKFHSPTFRRADRHTASARESMKSERYGH